MKSINQHQRAKKAWEVLVQVAKRDDFIRYKELGDEIGIHHRAIRFVLAIIQDYCSLNNLPPLTILVGNKLGIPGKGFIAWDPSSSDEGKNKVYNHNWGAEPNPFAYAIDGLTEEELVTSLLVNPECSKDIYAKVKVRGTVQIIFRKALLKAYKSRCAMCGLSFEFALQAAHIVSWNNASHAQRLDVRNGILLCATHHCLFDKGIIRIKNDYTISVLDTLIPKSRYDSLLTSAINNQKIVLPSNRLHWPVFG